MIKLKGGPSKAQETMSKALGLSSRDKKKGGGGGGGGGSSGEGNALARQLGMPTATGMGRSGGTRIGVTPTIRSKTQGDKARTDGAGSDSEDDEDDLLLDEDFEKLRAKRLEKLKKQVLRDQEFKAMGHGALGLITEEEFLPTCTKSKYVVCHFFHREFSRCAIVDKHLKLLSAKYIATRFVKIDAEKTPFFVGKLKVRMLPTIVLFKDGVAIDRIVGFDELGATDEFSTEVMERRIAKSGVIASKELTKEHKEKKKRALAREQGAPSKNIRTTRITFGHDDDDASD